MIANEPVPGALLPLSAVVLLLWIEDWLEAKRVAIGETADEDNR